MSNTHIAEDIAILVGSLAQYREGVVFLMDQLEDAVVSDEILDQMRHADYTFGDVCDTLNSVVEDLLNEGYDD